MVSEGRSHFNGGLGILLLVFVTAAVAPIIAVVPLKTKLLICAFVTSVISTSGALVSALFGWDVLSEFLHGLGM